MERSPKPRIKLADFGLFDARAARGREVARALDNKTPIPYSVLVCSHTFDEFLSSLTPARLELLRLSKAGSRSIAELAAATQRGRSAVSRDIAKLAALGLVDVTVEASSGGDVKKVVRPAAGHIEIHTAAG